MVDKSQGIDLKQKSQVLERELEYNEIWCIWLTKWKPADVTLSTLRTIPIAVPKKSKIKEMLSGAH
jgi:hypothetical protein